MESLCFILAHSYLKKLPKTSSIDEVDSHSLGVTVKQAVFMCVLSLV